MVRFLASCVSFFLCVHLGFAQSISLPNEVHGEPAEWIIVAPEKIDGGQTIKWDIDPALRVIRLDLLIGEELAAKVKGKVVVGKTPGKYRVRAWNAKADVPSDLATCWVVIDGPVPIPVPPQPAPPEPVPPQPAPASKIGVVLIKDSRNDNGDQLVLLAKAKAWAESKGHVTWVRDTRSADAETYNAAINGLALPALVFINPDGSMRGKPAQLPGTLEAIQQAVKDHGGLTDDGIQMDDKGDYVLHGGVKRYLTAKRTSPEKMKAFKRYGESWPVIPQAKWKDFTMADLAAPRILDQNGRGACFPMGTRIRMWDGSEKPIEDIRLLDQVLTAEGNKGTVVETMVRREEECLVNLAIWGHRHLKLTKEHPVLTRRGYIAAGDLRLDDWVAMPRHLPQSAKIIQAAGFLKEPQKIRRELASIRHFNAPEDRTHVQVRCYNNVPDAIHLTPNFGAICGLFLAEGRTDSRKTTWTFNANEKDTLVAELVRMLRAELDLEAHVQFRPNNSINVVVYGGAWARLFEGMFSNGSGNKRVCPEIMSGPKSFLESLLMAWMAGDGYQRRTMSQGVSVSHDLALSMYDIAQALGKRPAIRRSEPKGSHGITSRLPRWDVEFGGSGKDSYRCEQDDKHVWRKVAGIELEAFSGHVYNFEVEGDHSYVAEGIGVHNCVGHGAVGAFELAWRFNGRQQLEFCPWFVYGLVNGGEDRGAIVGDSLTAMQKTGVALWGTIPYSEYRQSRFPQKAFTDAKRFHPDLVYQCRSWDEMCSAVQRGHPVVFGIEIGSRFTPDSRGVVPPQSGGGGGHCMFACGLRSISGKWHVHVVNSWSTSFGANGTCYMESSYFDRDSMYDAYAIVTVQNDPQDPMPLPRLKTALRTTDREIQFASVP